MPKFNRTDYGNAEHFASLNKGKAVFDHQRGKWFLWTGVRWQLDDADNIRFLAKRAIRQRRADAEAIDDKDSRDKEIIWTLQSESDSRISAMLRLSQSDPALKTTGRFWDKDAYLIGARNAIIDLRTGKPLNPSPKQMITSAVATDFDKNADCPLWKATLESFWGDNPQVIEYVQRAIGYCFTGEVKEQALFCLFGEGSNGKSVFQNTLVRLAGDYGYVAPFAILEFRDRNSVSNDVAILQGKRLVIASETQENVRLNEGRIKSLTGDSHITARFLYQESFTFSPVAKFWLSFNHKPKATDDSHGFWRRIRLINLYRIFSESEQDKDLEQKLMAEYPGIFNWIIEGCQMWISDGLHAPASIEISTKLYREESNPIREFIEDCCVTDDNGKVSNSELWHEYLAWCRREGERFQLGRKGFSQRLQSMGFIQVKIGSNDARGWKGLSLRGLEAIVKDDAQAVN